VAAKNGAKAWVNRIVGYGEADPEELLANENNPKIHPQAQQKLLEASLDEVGWLTEVIVNKREGKEWGNLQGEEVLLDGHARVILALRRGEKSVPIKYVNLETPQLERKALLLLDPTGALFVHDPDTVAMLNENLDWDNDLLRDFASVMETQNKIDLDVITSSIFGDDEALAEEGDGEGGGVPQSDGSLLAAIKVTIDEPKHQVANREVWKVGRHVLICANVMTDWSLWSPYLEGPTTVFVPYPGPLMAATEAAQEHVLVMVQPDPYIAGHILDRYEDLFGDKGVERVTTE